MTSVSGGPTNGSAAAGEATPIGKDTQQDETSTHAPSPAVKKSTRIRFTPRIHRPGSSTSHTHTDAEGANLTATPAQANGESHADEQKKQTACEEKHILTQHAVEPMGTDPIQVEQDGPSIVPDPMTTATVTPVDESELTDSALSSFSSQPMSSSSASLSSPAGRPGRLRIHPVLARSQPPPMQSPTIQRDIQNQSNNTDATAIQSDTGSIVTLHGINREQMVADQTQPKSESESTTDATAATSEPLVPTAHIDSKAHDISNEIGRDTITELQPIVSNTADGDDDDPPPGLIDVDHLTELDSADEARDSDVPYSDDDDVDGCGAIVASDDSDSDDPSVVRSSSARRGSVVPNGRPVDILDPLIEDLELEPEESISEMDRRRRRRKARREADRMEAGTETKSIGTTTTTTTTTTNNSRYTGLIDGNASLTRTRVHTSINGADPAACQRGVVPAPRSSSSSAAALASSSTLPANSLPSVPSSMSPPLLSLPLRPTPSSPLTPTKVHSAAAAMFGSTTPPPSPPPTTANSTLVHQATVAKTNNNNNANNTTTTTQAIVTPTAPSKVTAAASPVSRIEVPLVQAHDSKSAPTHYRPPSLHASPSASPPSSFSFSVPSPSSSRVALSVSSPLRSVVPILRWTVPTEFTSTSWLHGHYRESEHELYFAYGSNMNIDRMQARRTGIVGGRGISARLANFRLVFNKLSESLPLAQRYMHGAIGYANCVPDQHSMVFGVVYILRRSSSTGLSCLDHYEGVSQSMYARRLVPLALQDGSTVVATTYIACQQACATMVEQLAPTKSYIKHLLAGKEMLPETYFQALTQVRISWMDDPTDGIDNKTALEMSEPNTNGRYSQVTASTAASTASSATPPPQSPSSPSSSLSPSSLRVSSSLGVPLRFLSPVRSPAVGSSHNSRLVESRSSPLRLSIANTDNATNATSGSTNRLTGDVASNLHHAPLHASTFSPVVAGVDAYAASPRVRLSFEDDGDDGGTAVDDDDSLDEAAWERSVPIDTTRNDKFNIK